MTTLREETALQASFRSIEDLQSCGINVSDINKLKEAGIATIDTVLQLNSRHLEIKGLSEAKLEKIMDAAKKLDLRGNAFNNPGIEVKEQRQQVVHITTGSSALDMILGGGIKTGSTTELFGEFGEATELAHTLCVTSQMSIENSGGQGKVIYLDTKRRKLNEAASDFVLSFVNNPPVMNVMMANGDIPMYIPNAAAAAKMGTTCILPKVAIMQDLIQIRTRSMCL